MWFLQMPYIIIYHLLNCYFFPTSEILQQALPFFLFSLVRFFKMLLNCFYLIVVFNTCFCFFYNRDTKNIKRNWKANISHGSVYSISWSIYPCMIFVGTNFQLLVNLAVFTHCTIYFYQLVTKRDEKIFFVNFEVYSN